jgi:hypothetical protein
MTKNFSFCGLIETAESDFGDFRIDFLSEYEAIYAKRLQPMNQGPRGDCLMKKTEGRKSRDTVPLMQ